MSGVLTGKIALVTGGSRGIGKAIAEAMAAAGARVALTFRNEKDKAGAIVSAIKAKGGEAISLAMEVTDRASVMRALSDVEAQFGGLNVLVNNAGINKPTDFDQISDADWDNILSVNLKGPFICAQAALPLMAKSGGGSIIQIGSVSGQYGGPRTAHYAASKAGLISLSQVIARFGAKSNIRSNTIAAGLIASEMADAGMQSPAVKAAAEQIVMKRFGTTQEVANAAVFLASDASSYITAQTINVNGGLYF
ncbi:MAG TPA: SDR family oxidoreductase [Micropepsaceae bacterium]|nr:SDR family oxidoreductase [Micropepsaceae bacterium]HRK71447.1 SDR family oxidoreductase [Micropepsaceae bacterium]